MSTLGWILILVSAGLAVGANLFLRAGVDRAGGFSTHGGIYFALLNLIKQPFFDVGIIMYALATIVWIRILSIEPLSVAYPVLVSITFMMVTLGAVVLFNESLNGFKIIGLLVIVGGIILISRS